MYIGLKFQTNYIGGPEYLLSCQNTIDIKNK